MTSKLPIITTSNIKFIINIFYIIKKVIIIIFNQICYNIIIDLRSGMLYTVYQ